MACVVTAQRYAGLATRKGSTDARDAVRPFGSQHQRSAASGDYRIAEKEFPTRAEPMVPSEDDEFLREVWQEVGTTCTKPCGITAANASCSRLPQFTRLAHV